MSRANRIHRSILAKYRQQDVIDYLQEENQVLRDQLGDKRLRFSVQDKLCLAESPGTTVRLSGDGREH